MAELEISAQVRTQVGRGDSRRLRRAGAVPAVVYGRRDGLRVSLHLKKLRELLSTAGRTNAIFQLNLDGEEYSERKVIVKEIQHHPVSGDMLHLDLYEVSMEKEIVVSVPLRFMGEPVGVKMSGGILGHLLREVEVECLPGRIPEFISLEVSQLEIGDALHVRDLPVQEGIRILNDPDEAVVSISAPAVEEVAKPAEEVPVEGEAAEGAAAQPAAEAGKEKEKEKDRDRDKEKERGKSKD
ncbi:MAG TPA: 50S ribosomal protein L25/general stress protein Ctc [bacterium]|nr:50S ribosomal protein L25/general stress protein Ctc [bacterium]